MGSSGQMKRCILGAQKGLSIAAGGKVEGGTGVRRRETTVMATSPINPCCGSLTSFCLYPYL